MRSLFVKIFLWFWLATVLVVGVLALTSFDRPPESGRDHFRTVLDTVLTSYGQRALDAYARSGDEGLRAAIDDIHEKTGMRFEIYRDDQNLLGGAAANDLLPFLKEVARHNDTQLADSAAPRKAAARAFPAADGPPYIVVADMPPGPLSSLLDRPYSLVLRLLAVVAMAGVVCYGLARYLTAPLRRLGLSTRRLAHGDLAARVGPSVGHRRDEIGELGRDFDFMAGRVESLVTAQRQLLRDMSHELRSPLTRLNVALELATRAAGPDAHDALGRIGREAERLNELIGQLLTLARIESRVRPEGHADVDLATLIEAIVADADFEASSRGRCVEFTHCDPCVVKGDPELLRSAIENVVRNAIRYTVDGTTVEVSLTCTPGGPTDAGGATIQVRDHGPGVPEKTLRDIFQPFYRAAHDNDRRSGAGLGLAIAQQAIECHGGTITAANAATGGLLVRIDLPGAAT